MEFRRIRSFSGKQHQTIASRWPVLTQRRTKIIQSRHASGKAIVPKRKNRQSGELLGQTRPFFTIHNARWNLGSSSTTKI